MGEQIDPLEAGNTQSKGKGKELETAEQKGKKRKVGYNREGNEVIGRTKVIVKEMGWEGRKARKGPTIEKCRLYTV